MAVVRSAAAAKHVDVRETAAEVSILPGELKRIAQNTFIAQSKGKDGGYLYGLLVFEPDRIFEYAVDCPDFTAEEAQRYGIVHDKDGDDCTVSSAQGLADAYLAYLKKGPSPAASMPCADAQGIS
jgi:hypothetical protein